MNLYLIFIIIASVLGIEVCFKNFNKEYLSKSNTACIKGIFILIVFYSHYVTYTHVNMSKDFLMYDLRQFLGQLMVTLFLFYSGYGIFESIKKKKNDYIKALPKNRIFKTWFHFAIAVFSFLIIGLILKKEFTIKKIVLSFIGWDCLGNSNWYIFGIIFLYIMTYLSFNIFTEEKQYKKGIILNWLLTIIFILFLSIYKDSYFYNTLACYNLGMTYSFYKDKIEKIIFDRKKYFISLIITIFAFFTLYKYQTTFIHYEFLSIVFALLIVQLSMIVNFKSKILKWFGDNLFWVYILQRLPMMVYSHIGLNTHPYRFALASFITTIILTIIYKYLVDKIDAYILKNNLMHKKTT